MGSAAIEALAAEEEETARARSELFLSTRLLFDLDLIVLPPRALAGAARSVSGEAMERVDVFLSRMEGG